MSTNQTSILYSSIRSPHCLKAAMVLDEKGVPFQRVEVDLRARQQKSDAYLAINPLGQVPAYQDNHGIHYDSLQIMLHLDEHYPKPRLFPVDPTVHQEVLFWIELSGGRMRDVSHELYWQLIEPPEGGTDNRLVMQLKEEGTNLLARVEVALKDAEWICGDLSAADFALFPWIYGYQRFQLPQPGQFPNVEAWRDRISSRQSFVDNFQKVGIPFASL